MIICRRCQINIWCKCDVTVVKKIVTNLAVVEVSNKGFKLLERAPGISVKEIKSATEGTLIVEGDIPEMRL